MANEAPEPSGTVKLPGSSPEAAPAETATVANHPIKIQGPAPSTEVLEKFGRYQLRQLLGQGGMGSVYLAFDTVLQRTVALKIPRLVGADQERRARLLREARAAAMISHPSICPVYDVGEINGQLYLTMAYLEGVSLAQLLRERGQLAPREAARIVRSIADAIHHAHKQGFLHRDLKPANIHLNKQGDPIVLDFGLAFRFDLPSKERLTEAGTVIGTPTYMPPEQILGEALGPAADIYSLGVMLYELLTGRVPFEGTIGHVIAQIETQLPRPPSAYCPGLDADLDAICLTAIAKEAKDRFASMEEFGQALAAYLAGKATEVIAASRSRKQPQLRRQRMPILAGIALVAFLVAGGGLIGHFAKWQAKVDDSAQNEAQGKRAYLSEMEPVIVVDWMKAPPTPFDEPEENRRNLPSFPGVVVEGKRSLHGIFMHPPPLPHGGLTKLGYNLNKKYQMFVAGVSLNDLPFMKGWKTETPVTFSVYGDGVLLWTSRPVSSQADADQCNVSVANVEVLILEVNCPGNPRRAHAVWIEPCAE